MPRDFSAEVMQLVDKLIDGQPYQARVVASEAVDWMKKNDPSLLKGWMDLHAEDNLWRIISQRDHSERAQMRAKASRSVFAEAAGAYADSGDASVLSGWLQTKFVVEGDIRKELRLLNGAELKFVAETYRKREESNALQKAFMLALAKKVGKKIVGDVFTEEQISELYDSCRGVSV